MVQRSGAVSESALGYTPRAMSPDDDDAELSTVLESRFAPTPVSSLVYTLVTSDGGGAEKRISLDCTHAGPLFVGTSVSCEFVLADRRVSRRHIALEVEGNSLRVRDLDSTNGTYVNGLRVREALLVGGETIRLGETHLRVEQISGIIPNPLPDAVAFGRMLGASREMRRLYRSCEKLAGSTLPVIIEGETGTGKEVLAESLHESGPRAAGPFVVFDCTMVSPNLLESELFGHEKGAFTGAVSRREGVFEQAHGGTLFLDEIGDLDLAMQPKLLRALERSQVRRVGGSEWIHFDTRILAATRRNLDEEVEKGRFRDDLFHRLAVMRIELPPLRARKGDVGILTQEFCRQLGAHEHAIPLEVISRWEHEPWPGNIRELRNAVARYVALGDVDGVDPDGRLGVFTDSTNAGAALADQWVSEVLARGLPFTAARQTLLGTFEEKYIERMLAAHGGNVSRAAAASGIARRYFQILRARRESKGE
jgi:DNA-binding NtrC family response regulator